MSFVCRLFILLFLVVGLISCSTTKKLRDHKGSYLESVKLNYTQGIKAIENAQYDKAISYFKFVKNKYPFSKYAALSDLQIANVRFLQKKWVGAASAYELFIRLHPRHNKVEYALYRIGISYFNALPGDFFLLPSKTKRDQTYTKKALSMLNRFIHQFPNSDYIKEAKDKRRTLFSYLAQHNMHVASYYYKRGKYQASVSRYLEVQDLYPQIKEASKALFQAAQIVENKLKDYDKAIELYALIVDQKKDSSYFEKAKANLQRLLRRQSDDLN